MLRAAQVPKGAGEDDWRSFAATASSLLDGRALATVPVLDYMLGETARAWLEERYGRLSEGDDGTAEVVGLIAAAAWPEGDILSEVNSAWTDAYLLAAVLSPLGGRPDALIANAAERSGMGADGRTAGRVDAALTARHGELVDGYSEARFVAAMFEGLNEGGLHAWAQGLALGVGILDAVWPTEAFVAEERRSLSEIAVLAKGGRVDLATRTEVVKFIRARLTTREDDGT